MLTRDKNDIKHSILLPRDAYVCVVYAVVSYLSVTSPLPPHCIETSEWIQLIYGTEAAVWLSHTVLGNKGIRVSLKIRVLPSEILSQTPSLADFWATVPCHRTVV